MIETLASRLMQSFEKYAARPAAYVGSGMINYHELQARSMGVAATLREHGIGPGHRVGIYLEKSFDALAVLLGSLLAGATYVPIDIRTPWRRCLLIANDSELSALAVDQRRRSNLSLVAQEFSALRLVFEAEFESNANPTNNIDLFADPSPSALDMEGNKQDRHINPLNIPCYSIASLKSACSTEILFDNLKAEDPAYILYTSGSTGRPKGVMLSHRAALGFVDWCMRTFQPTPEDRMTSHAPWHFDLSTFDLFVTFNAGASVRLLTTTESMLAPWLVRHLSLWGISYWYSVPSILIDMVEKGGLAKSVWPEAKFILFAGEPFPVPKLSLLQQAMSHARLFNLFGPTETNVCTYYEVKQSATNELQSLPIGRICEQLTGVILDEDLNEVEPGREGDLWIAGDNLFTGYWKDPELTHSKLRTLPQFAPNGLFYNTGDRVYQGEDGLLHFLGRRDFMVKVRGYRIELGEVENAIYTLPEVAEVAVVAIPQGTSHRLSAFISWKSYVDSNQTDILIARLQEMIPLYMVPDNYFSVTGLPRTSNGKVDRQQLIAKALQELETAESQMEFYQNLISESGKT
jgi:amino acid adenylation domain-containing protein